MATEGNNRIGTTITYDSQHALDAAQAYKNQIAGQLAQKLRSRPTTPAEQKLGSIDTKLRMATQGKASLPQNYSASLPQGVPSSGGTTTDNFLRRSGGNYSGRHRTNPVNMSAALDDDQFIQGAYQSLLGRDADDAGLAHWKSDLAGGASREDVVANIRRQPEYRDVFINDATELLIFSNFLTI